MGRDALGRFSSQLDVFVGYRCRSHGAEGKAEPVHSFGTVDGGLNVVARMRSPLGEGSDQDKDFPDRVVRFAAIQSWIR